MLKGTNNGTNVQNDATKTTEHLKSAVENFVGNKLEKQDLNDQMRTFLNNFKLDACKSCSELKWNEELAKVGREALRTANEDISKDMLNILEQKGYSKINNLVLTFDFNTETSPVNFVEKHHSDILDPQFQSFSIVNICNGNACTVAIIFSSLDVK